MLSPGVRARLAVEAGSPQGWHRYVGDHGDVLGVEEFGASAPGDVVMREYPIRTILHRFHNVEFMLAQVRCVNLSEKTVYLADRNIPYNYLLLAPGSTPNFYGVPGAKEYAFPLKILEDGGELRNHILRCYERAAQAQNVELRQREMTLVVVGGGTTGVEFIGVLIELISASGTT